MISNFNSTMDIFDNSINIYEKQMTSDILYLQQKVFEDGYITESTKKSIIDRVKDFFSKLMISIKKFIKEIQIKMKTIITDQKIKQKLKKMRNELEYRNQDELIDVIDVWNFKKDLLDINNKLWKYCDKFTKMKYNNATSIENDLKKFEEIVEESNKKIEIDSNKKIKVSVKNAIEFIDNELNGTNDVIKTIIKSIAKFDKMQVQATSLEAKYKIQGPDIIPKHIGFIERMALNLAKFLKKWISKFIMTVVFMFA